MKSKLEKREEKANHSMEKLQKVILGFIPGGHVIESLITYRSSLKQKRLIDFGDKLKEMCESELGLSTEDYDFENEDFVDLFELIMVRVQLTKSEEKLLCFRKIIVNHIKVESELSIVYADLTSQLHEIEIVILKAFIENEESRKRKAKAVSEKQNDHVAKESYVSHLMDKAEEGTIKPSESIARAKHSEVQALSQMIRAKDSFEQEVNSMNGKVLGITQGEYDFHVNNLMSSGLLSKQEVDPYMDGNKLPFILVTEFGKEYYRFISF